MGRIVFFTIKIFLIFVQSVRIYKPVTTVSTYVQKLTLVLKDYVYIEIASVLEYSIHKKTRIKSTNASPNFDTGFLWQCAVIGSCIIQEVFPFYHSHHRRRRYRRRHRCRRRRVKERRRESSESGHSRRRRRRRRRRLRRRRCLLDTKEARRKPPSGSRPPDGFE